jgi:molybdate transport system substrate-binding protein
MATRHLLTALFAEAADAGLAVVELESVGGVEAERRVAGGEQVDLVFLADGALRRLAGDGHVARATLVPLAVSRVAVAVPAPGASHADARDEAAFADAAGLRAALREADRIGYSTGPSGTALVRMIDAWGMAAELGDRLVQAPPGVPVARLLADRDVDLALQQESELVGQPGIRILGALPEDSAIDTVFAGAVATAATDPVAAAAVLERLAAPSAASLIRAHHFTPAYT